MILNTRCFKPAACLLALSALGWGAGLAQAQRPPQTPADAAAAVSVPTTAAGQPGVNASPQPQGALRRWTPTFKELGLGGAVRLRGVEGWSGMSLDIRRDEIVESARMHMRFTLSPSLLADLSHIKVLLNDQLIQTIALPKERLGQPHMVDIDIPANYFTDYNHFAFQFIGHYTMDCEFPDHTSLWAEINNDSFLDLSLRSLPLPPELGLLPAPFFDPRDNRVVNVPFVFAAHPGLGPLKASGAVASWLGMLSDYRGSRFPVFEDRLPPRNAIVFATNDQRPGFLRNIPPVQQPTLTMVAHPGVPGALLLLVLGKDDAQIQTAAEALALNKAALSGQSIRVTDLKPPPLRKAYDAPRWLTTKRPVQFGELVANLSDLQLRGASLYSAVHVRARMAPDLFTWNADNIPVNLIYRYTPTKVSDRGALNVAINDQFVRAYPLKSNDGNASLKDTVLLPLTASGDDAVNADMGIPAFMVGGDNVMEFAFNIPADELGRCRSTQPVELRAAVDPQSTIDITGLDHYMAMPNIAAFANNGFPFTKYADLHETSVVLPNEPTSADVEAYLTSVGRMSAATGYPGTRFRLLHAAQIQQAKNSDILLVSVGDSDGVLANWQRNLPALIEAGRRAVHPLDRGVNAFFELFRLGPSGEDSPAVSGDIHTTLEGDGPLAGMVGLQSPLQSGRSVVALTASDAGAMGLVSRALTNPGRVRLLQGDLGLMRGDAVESFRINPIYYVGELPWYKRLWFHLHSHPVWLALLGIIVGLLLTLLVYGSLRSLARRRLEAVHD